MDKIKEQINSILFEAFGLCPEYEVQWTDKEWIEFYTPFFNDVAKWRDWIYKKENNFADYKEPNRIRLHLNEHKVITENKLCVTANFAVHHPSRTVFLKILKISGQDAYCTVSQYG